MTVTVLTGDCRDILRTLPSESVHCVVTSPPYWGLRDYGVAGQLGLEPSLACIACRIRQLAQLEQLGGSFYDFAISDASRIKGLEVLRS